MLDSFYSVAEQFGEVFAIILREEGDAHLLFDVLAPVSISYPSYAFKSVILWRDS